MRWYCTSWCDESRTQGTSEVKRFHVMLGHGGDVRTKLLWFGVFDFVLISVRLEALL